MQSAREECIELRQEASDLQEYSNAKIARVTRYLGVLAEKARRLGSSLFCLSLSFQSGFCLTFLFASCGLFVAGLFFLYCNPSFILPSVTIIFPIDLCNFTRLFSR